MQERGITTTAVIIYVIIATIVIATFSVITTDFYETLKKENYNTKKDKITVNFKAGDFSKIGDNALVFYMNK